MSTSLPIEIRVADVVFRVHLPDPAASQAVRSRYAAFTPHTGEPRAGDWDIAVRLTPPQAGPLPLWVRHTPKRTYFRVGMQRGSIDLESRRAVLYIPHMAHLFVALERSLAYILSQELPARGRGMLVHAAGINLAGGAHVFLGPSGAGKSTVAALAWGRYPVLGDENLVLYRDAQGRFWVYSTPCWGINTPPERIHRAQARLPLTALYALRHASYFSLRPFALPEGVLALMRDEKAPMERRDTAQAWLALAHRLVETTPFLELSFPPRTTLWDFLRFASPRWAKLVQIA